MRYHDWTPEEERFIIEQAPWLSNRQMANRLGVPIGAVSARAYRLRKRFGLAIPRRPHQRARDLEWLKDYRWSTPEALPARRHRGRYWGREELIYLVAAAYAGLPLADQERALRRPRAAIARRRLELARAGIIEEGVRRRHGHAVPFGAEEEALVRRLAGTMEAVEIAREINAALGLRRTKHSVRALACQATPPIDLVMRHYTLEGFATLVGREVRTVKAWIGAGLLHTTGLGVRRRRAYIPDDEIRRFAAACPWYIDVTLLSRAFADRRMAEELRVRAPRDPWVPLVDLAREFDVPEAYLRRLCHEGVLDHHVLNPLAPRKTFLLRRGDVARMPPFGRIEWLSAEEAARCLATSPDAVLALAATGDLAHVRRLSARHGRVLDLYRVPVERQVVPAPRMTTARRRPTPLPASATARAA